VTGGVDRGLEGVAAEAAAAAAAVLADVGLRSTARQKGAVDWVTEADLRAEAAVREVLARHTPDVPIVGEEGGGDRAARTAWVVDPLDGTTNFVHGFPFYAVSVGLLVDGVPEVGVVVDVVRKRTFRATRGRGGTVEGDRLQVSDVDVLDRALCATGFAYDRRQRAAFYLRFVQAALERSQGIRRAGAAALDLAHVACGAIDAYWEFSLSPWDVVAGIVLVREAGGRVDPIPGLPLLDPANVIATNGRVHGELIALMSRILEEGP
jgi:myo-inositol-1(or 4)-monophosphatase